MHNQKKPIKTPRHSQQRVQHKLTFRDRVDILKRHNRGLERLEPDERDHGVEPLQVRHRRLHLRQEGSQLLELRHFEQAEARTVLVKHKHLTLQKSRKNLAQTLAKARLGLREMLRTILRLFVLFSLHYCIFKVENNNTRVLQV